MLPLRQMKITIETNKMIHTTEVLYEPNMDQLVDVLKGLMVQTGFHPETVEDAFNTEAGENGSWNIKPATELDPHNLYQQTN